MKSYQKEMHCKGPCGAPTIWEKGWDYTVEGNDPAPIWKCNCCGNTVKRIIKTNKGETK